MAYRKRKWTPRTPDASADSGPKKRGRPKKPPKPEDYLGRLMVTLRHQRDKVWLPCSPPQGCELIDQIEQAIRDGAVTFDCHPYIDGWVLVEDIQAVQYHQPKVTKEESA